MIIKYTVGKLALVFGVWTNGKVFFEEIVSRGGNHNEKKSIG
jgi:hypothetical protein